MISMNELLVEAKSKGASDLHLTVGLSPKIRVNGTLVSLEYDRLKPEDLVNMIQSLLSEKNHSLLLEQGQIDFAYSIPGVGRFRMNVFRQRGSYALAARIVGNKIPDASTLGIPSSVLKLIQQKRGLILVTGPTGSGKSTTLATLIDIINTYDNMHIITLEDPIEFLHAHKKSIVNQREIGLDSLSYNQALRSALREDPDVILVGEMRDLETIATTITAAETGHLVLSSLHTTGAVNSIDRMIDVFPPHQQQQVRIQLAGVLNGVISQVLIPTKDNNKRVAAFEVMISTVSVQNLIRESKTHQILSCIQTGKKLGMQTMDDAIYELYVDNKIDASSALAYAQNKELLSKKLY